MFDLIETCLRPTHLIGKLEHVFKTISKEAHVQVQVSSFYVLSVLDQAVGLLGKASYIPVPSFIPTFAPTPTVPLSTTIQPCSVFSGFPSVSFIVI